MAPRIKVAPTVEFCCPMAEAFVDANINEFFSERPAQPVDGRLTFTRFRIRDVDASDRLRFRADFALGTGTDGIIPSTSR